MAVTPIPAFRTSDNRLFEDADAAAHHELWLSFHKWCSEHVCIGGEWSADMVATEIFEHWHVRRRVVPCDVRST